MQHLQFMLNLAMLQSVLSILMLMVRSFLPPVAFNGAQIQLAVMADDATSTEKMVSHLVNQSIGSETTVVVYLL